MEHHPVTNGNSRHSSSSTTAAKSDDPLPYPADTATIRSQGQRHQHSKRGPDTTSPEENITAKKGTDDQAVQIRQHNGHRHISVVGAAQSRKRSRTPSFSRSRSRPQPRRGRESRAYRSPEPPARARSPYSRAKGSDRSQYQSYRPGDRIEPRDYSRSRQSHRSDTYDSYTPGSSRPRSRSRTPRGSRRHQPREYSPPRRHGSSRHSRERRVSRSRRQRLSRSRSISRPRRRSRSPSVSRRSRPTRHHHSRNQSRDRKLSSERPRLGKSSLEQYKEYSKSHRRIPAVGSDLETTGSGSRMTTPQVSHNTSKPSATQSASTDVHPTSGHGSGYASAGESEEMAVDQDTVSHRSTSPSTTKTSRNTLTIKINHHMDAHGRKSSTPYIPNPDYIPGSRTSAYCLSLGDIEQFDKIGQVGEGTYGKVYKARHPKVTHLVALKRIRMEAEREGFPITAMREIKLLTALNHPNIVQLYQTIHASDHSVYMVFEYMDYDLAGMIAHPDWALNAAHIKCLMQQMLSGLAYLHTHGVLHRDIKGSNLLLNKRGQIKFADFGLARHFDPLRMHDYTNRVITLWYRPPELLLGTTLYGPPADVWSLGCIMLELFQRKPVFSGTDEISQLDAIYRILGTPTPTTPSPGDSNSHPQLACATVPTPTTPTAHRSKEDVFQERKEEEVEDPVAQVWPEMAQYPWYFLLITRKRYPRKFRSTFRQLPYMTSEAMHFMEQLLQFNPKQRLSAQQALEHPYFTSEQPKPALPEEIPLIDGDWHEYEYKAKRKQQLRQQRMTEATTGPSTTGIK
ncbi:kinase subunit of RNA polymerase II carboxy-terminal domain kinase I [Dispira simplex]|nr:kinase subunit of RNA polymerase II carboxy-terminal domain kinase I [Dispira simplex]